MHVLGMMQPIPQLLQREAMYMQLMVPRIPPILRNPMKHNSPKTLTHHQMTSTRCTRPIRPRPLSGYQRDQSRKSLPSTLKKPFKKYDGPVYVPAEVYKLLSPEVVSALKKYNAEAIIKFAKKKGIHVTDIAGHESTPSENTTHEEQSAPTNLRMQLKVRLTQFWTISTAKIIKKKT